MTSAAAAEIRSAVAADLGAVAAIYDHEVTHSVATFDEVAPPPSYWAAKLASTETGDHLLVAVLDAVVVGYAYSSSYRPRPAYRMTRETSVYLAESARGLGVGRALYDELLARLRSDGIRTAVAVVAQPNSASEALHRASGFTRVGVLHQVGWKFSRWIDTAWWECSLAR